MTARIVARASVLGTAVQRMAAQLGNHHQARGASRGVADQQFSSTPAGVRQDAAQPVYEIAGGRHGCQYRRLEKGSSRIGLPGGASSPLRSGINTVAQMRSLRSGKMRPPDSFRPPFRPRTWPKV